MFRKLLPRNPARVIMEIGEWKGDGSMCNGIMFKGKKYKVVNRKAREGELIMITNPIGTFDKYFDGNIFKVDEEVEYGVRVNEVKTRSEKDNPNGYISDDEYVVLESPKSTEDILSQEIVGLKKEQAELSDKLDEISKRISDDELAELGAEIVRVVERRRANIELD